MNTRTITTSEENTEESIIQAISDFIMRICSLERYVEIKRQALSDKKDFEPYVAFQRLCRVGSLGIDQATIVKFLNSNRISMHPRRVLAMVNHYDTDGTGVLSYKEFLEVVLPKEHPDLRSYVTQRECYEMKQEDMMSFATEKAMAVLFNWEIKLLEDTLPQMEELQRLGLDCSRIIEIIDGSPEGNLNFNNLQKFLNHAGFMPYDSEIISFLRRVDRDDDGVITTPELGRFLERFVMSQAPAFQIAHHAQPHENTVVSTTNFEFDYAPGIPMNLTTQSHSQYDTINTKALDGSMAINMLPLGSANHSVNHIGNSYSLIQQNQIEASILNTYDTAPAQPPQMHIDSVENTPTPVMNKRMDSTRYIRMSHHKSMTPETDIQVSTPPPQLPVQQQKTLSPSPVSNGFGGRETVIYRRKDFNRVFESPSPLKKVEQRVYDSPSSIDEINYPPRQYLRTPTAKFNKQMTLNTENPHHYNSFGINNLERRVPEIVEQKSPIQIREKENIDYSQMHNYQLPTAQKSNNKSTTKSTLDTPNGGMRRGISRVQALLKRSRFDYKASEYQGKYNKDLSSGSQVHIPKSYNYEQNQKNSHSRAKQPIVAPVHQPVIVDPHGGEILSANQSTQKDEPYSSRRIGINGIQKKNNSLRKRNQEEGAKPLERSVSRLQKSRDEQRMNLLSKVRKSSKKVEIYKNQPNQNNHISNTTPISQRRPSSILNSPYNQNKATLNCSILGSTPQGYGSISSNRKLQVPNYSRGKEPGNTPSSSSKDTQRCSKSRKRKRYQSNEYKNHSSRKSGSKSRTRQGSKRQHRRFLSKFSVLIYQEKLLEELRVSLSSRSDFNIRSAFSVLFKDCQNNQQISFEDFRLFIHQLNLAFIDSRALVELFSSLEDTNNRRMGSGFNLFMDLLLPANKSYAARLQNSILDLQQSSSVSNESFELIKKIVQQIFECKRILKESKLYFKQKNLDFHRIFDKIDSQRKGYLIKDDFLKFLKEGIPEFREGGFQEVNIFTQKCDLDNDGKVTFKDFYMFFSL